MSLRATVSASAAVLVLLAFAAVVTAQPAASPQPVPAPSAQPAPPPSPDAQPAPEPSRGELILQRFTFGVHLFTGSLQHSLDGSDSGPTSSMTGYGAYLRFRFNDRWEAELAARKSSGSFASTRSHEFIPITGSVLAHVVDFYGVGLYARAGLGKAAETVDRTSHYDDWHLHLGAGAQFLRLWNNIGVSAEIRYVRTSRTDVPRSFVTSGLQYGLGVGYSF